MGTIIIKSTIKFINIKTDEHNLAFGIVTFLFFADVGPNPKFK